MWTNKKAADNMRYMIHVSFSWLACVHADGNYIHSSPLSSVSSLISMACVFGYLITVFGSQSISSQLTSTHV